MVYWYEGTLHHNHNLAIAPNDPGFLYGATVFTTMRIYGQNLHHPLGLWPAHQGRLQSHLATLGFTEPDWGQLLQGLAAMVSRFPVLRITIFFDGRSLITGRPLPENLREKQTQGITAGLLPPATLRSLAAQKTGNYLGPWRALNQGKQQGHGEMILRNPQGHWLETCTGNLWGYGQGSWLTPPLDGQILGGTLRQYLLERGRSLGLTIKETPFTPEVIHQLEVLAYSNSVVVLVPIHWVDSGEEQRPFSFSRCRYHEVAAPLLEPWQSVTPGPV